MGNTNNQGFAPNPTKGALLEKRVSWLQPKLLIGLYYFLRTFGNKKRYRKKATSHKDEKTPTNFINPSVFPVLKFVFIELFQTHICIDNIQVFHVVE